MTATVRTTMPGVCRVGVHCEKCAVDAEWRAKYFELIKIDTCPRGDRNLPNSDRARASVMAAAEPMPVPAGHDGTKPQPAYIAPRLDPCHHLEVRSEKKSCCGGKERLVRVPYCRLHPGPTSRTTCASCADYVVRV